MLQDWYGPETAVKLGSMIRAVMPAMKPIGCSAIARLTLPHRRPSERTASWQPVQFERPDNPIEPTMVRDAPKDHPKP